MTRDAVYRRQAVPSYGLNPFLEALPPLMSREEWAAALEHPIRFPDELRRLPSHVRLHVLWDVVEYFQPLTLHLEYAESIDVLIRHGYKRRNPLAADFVERCRVGAIELSTLDLSAPGPISRAAMAKRSRLNAGLGLTMLGPSGTGKTVTVDAILRCYPQVIEHPRLSGALRSLYQLVWLKISVPPEGSIKAMCLDCFAAIDEVLDTGYRDMFIRSSPTAEKLRGDLAQIACLHGLGLIVLDEVHNLDRIKSGGAYQIMKFLKLFRDVMQVPVMLVGTPKAKYIVGSNFQMARRHAGRDEFRRMGFDGEFRLFCESMLDGQILRVVVPLDDSLLRAFYDLSQGIAAISVLLFLLAQERSLRLPDEPPLSAALLEAVYRDQLPMLHPYMDLLRVGGSIDEDELDVVLDTLTSAMRHRTPYGLRASSLPTEANQPAPKLEATHGDMPGAASVRGEAKRKARGPVQPSRCELVQIVEQGKRRDLSAHDALAAEGLIQPLGGLAAGA